MGADVMNILANYSPSRFVAQNQLLQQQVAQQRALTPTVGPMAQEQLRAEQLKNQVAQQQLKDAEITRDTIGAVDWSDPVKGMADFRDKLLRDPRKVSGAGYMGAMQHVTDMFKNTMALTDEQHKQEKYTQEQTGTALTASLNAPAESKQDIWTNQVVPRMQALHPGQQLPALYPGDDKVRGMVDLNNMGGSFLEMRAKVAETKASEAKAALEAAQTPGAEAESKIKQAQAAGMANATPQGLKDQVDAVLPPAKYPDENNEAMVMASKARAAGLGETAVQKAITDVKDRVGRRESAIAQAKATAPIKIYTAAETERQKNALDALTPESLDMAAEYYRKTGAMPQLGMRNPAAMRQIMNRAAAMGPVDLASDKAAFAANQSSLTGIVKNRDAVAAFENTAGKNLDLFLQKAQPVIDAGSPWINTPLRAVSERALGSTDLPAFQAARQVAINEIAKVTSNPGLAGQLSDTARKEVESFIPANATLGQIYSVAKVLKQDMANRHESYNEQIADIQKRLGGSPATVTTPTAAAPHEKYSPSTGKHYISTDGGKTWQVKP